MFWVELASARSYFGLSLSWVGSSCSSFFFPTHPSECRYVCHGSPTQSDEVMKTSKQCCYSCSPGSKTKWMGAGWSILIRVGQHGTWIWKVTGKFQKISRTLLRTLFHADMWIVYRHHNRIIIISLVAAVGCSLQKNQTFVGLIGPEGRYRSRGQRNTHHLRSISNFGQPGWLSIFISLVIISIS